MTEPVSMALLSTIVLSGLRSAGSAAASYAQDAARTGFDTLKEALLELADEASAESWWRHGPTGAPDLLQKRLEETYDALDRTLMLPVVRDELEALHRVLEAEVHSHVDPLREGGLKARCRAWLTGVTGAKQTYDVVLRLFRSILASAVGLDAETRDNSSLLDLVDLLRARDQRFVQETGLIYREACEFWCWNFGMELSAPLDDFGTRLAGWCLDRYADRFTEVHDTGLPVGDFVMRALERGSSSNTATAAAWGRLTSRIGQQGEQSDLFSFLNQPQEELHSLLSLVSRVTDSTVSSNLPLQCTVLLRGESLGTVSSHAASSTARLLHLFHETRESSVTPTASAVQRREVPGHGLTIGSSCRASLPRALALAETQVHWMWDDPRRALPLQRGRSAEGAPELFAEVIVGSGVAQSSVRIAVDLHWRQVTVTSGEDSVAQPMARRSTFTVGSSPECDLVLPLILPEQFTIRCGVGVLQLDPNPTAGSIWVLNNRRLLLSETDRYCFVLNSVLDNKFEVKVSLASDSSWWATTGSKVYAALLIAIAATAATMFWPQNE